MKRVNHMLTEKQIVLLERARKMTGLSASELIRRALDAYLLKLLGEKR